MAGLIFGPLPRVMAQVEARPKAEAQMGAGFEGVRMRLIRKQALTACPAIA